MPYLPGETGVVTEARLRPFWDMPFMNGPVARLGIICSAAPSVKVAVAGPGGDRRWLTARQALAGK
jgi:hypothetical protein